MTEPSLEALNVGLEALLLAPDAASAKMMITRTSNALEADVAWMRKHKTQAFIRESQPMEFEPGVLDAWQFGLHGTLDHRPSLWVFCLGSSGLYITIPVFRGKPSTY